MAIIIFATIMFYCEKVTIITMTITSITTIGNIIIFATIMFYCEKVTVVLIANVIILITKSS